LVRHAKKNFHAQEQKVIIYYGAAICGNFWGVGVPAPNAQEQEHQIN